MTWIEKETVAALLANCPGLVSVEHPRDHELAVARHIARSVVELLRLSLCEDCKKRYNERARELLGGGKP